MIRLAAVEAEQAKLFEEGAHTAEFRFRKKDGTYCWVSDEQQLIREWADGQGEQSREIKRLLEQIARERESEKS